MLLLDRGHPAAWLINLLLARGIHFVIRCDTRSGGWRNLRQFIRGDCASLVGRRWLIKRPQPRPAPPPAPGPRGPPRR